MTDLPEIALAVRQPWAWAIIHAGKDVENRSWLPQRSTWRQRGRVAILASKGMTQDEYWEASDFMKNLGIICPRPHELVRGAIIGSVEITAHCYARATHPGSPWFFGPGALLLRSPTACEPIPADGQLDFFKWKRADRGIEPPAKWMLPKEEAML